MPPSREGILNSFQLETVQLLFQFITKFYQNTPTTPFKMDASRLG